jgi:hypothetical protein
MMNQGQWLIGAGCVTLFGTAMYHASFYTSMVRDMGASDVKPVHTAFGPHSSSRFLGRQYRADSCSQTLRITLPGRQLWSWDVAFRIASTAIAAYRRTTTGSAKGALRRSDPRSPGILK